MRARLDACGVDAHSQCSASSMTEHMLRRFTNTPLHSQWSAGGTTELCLFTSKPPSLLCSASAECLTPYLCGVNAHSMHSASAATGHIHVPSVVSTTTNTITTAYGILYKKRTTTYPHVRPPSSMLHHVGLSADRVHTREAIIVDSSRERTSDDRSTRCTGVSGFGLHDRTSVELVGREQSRVTLYRSWDWSTDGDMYPRRTPSIVRVRE
ncbi:hypothetical protein DFP72DRAFT_855293 [Ephemerocybe angulata]|uniref:Uncharacterized protein n=1 Tax=Ephemerocybe angulata TaxID=980116 RepID=A0A8H6HGG4_9AGAR|nr:hypothetical protein DFP72DRAFT_855293 [Tulosesus angulatus]